MALNDLPARWNRLAALVAAAATGFCGRALADEAAPLNLGLVRMGRDIAFIDMGGVRREGSTAHLRVLRVLETDTVIAGETYIGGWQALRADCARRTVAVGPYTAMRAGGRLGPATGGFSRPRPWPADSAEGAAGRAACGLQHPMVTAHGIDEAIQAGREALARAIAE